MCDSEQKPNTNDQQVIHRVCKRLQKKVLAIAKIFMYTRGIKLRKE